MNLNPTNIQQNLQATETRLPEQLANSHWHQHERWEYRLDSTLAQKNGGNGYLRAYHIAFGVKIDLFNFSKD